ncbi:MAG: hypothetical protein Q9171_003029 [Xanthocarpia ochracea]
MGMRFGDRRYKLWQQGPLTCDYFGPIIDFVEPVPILLELKLTDFIPIANMPDDYADTITNFNRLHRLKVFVNLDRYASDFGKGYEPPIRGKLTLPDFNPKLAREFAVDLFKRFFQKDPFAWLRSLEVCFTQQIVGIRSESIEPENLVDIQRLERDDAPSPLHGGFVVTAKEYCKCN